MEWQAIQAATQTGRYELHNGNGASNPHTPPPLESDCREYLETISVLLTTLGYPLLEPVREISLAGTPGEGGAAETLFFREGGTDARARPTTEGVLVLAGSVGKAIARPSLSASLARRRVALVEQGVAEVRGEEYVFVRDHLFSSPSTAGAIVVGGNINGRITWKTADGRTFQQLEDQALSSET
ncbi:DUF4357 domain-containing protein [Pseudarthrobacter sp. NCCP-2145]|uniref:DUF4357 domain-containing protein n=1 Tax=Pseudarthrobacter sp. NCCP-2145 TaxID=2942290 RepID=UPI002040F553|nr:DUF4357 domain-containing protein [Pseudarthrobacter sp. NCCP-2145]GKV72020.1 hypothetical protein NCCP2145_14010 [Pseudarthrobacter sp. NCCP-2145]